MKRPAPRAAAAAALALASGSCAQFTEAWQLTDFRILGVRAYETAEPSRNAPRPGSRATLELVTADTRERLVRVAWIVIPTPTFSLGGTSPSGDAGAADGGAPMIPSGGFRLPFTFLCDSPDFSLDIPGVAAIRCGDRAEFTVPTTLGTDGRGRSSLTVLGVACAGGRIRVRTPDADGGGASGGAVPFECTSESGMHRGWPFQYTLLVGTPAGGTARDNLHPRIAAIRAGVAGNLVPVADGALPTIAPCADQSRDTRCPRLRVEVDFADGSRERYMERDPNTGSMVERAERLVTGFIVDRGKLSGGFRTDSAADPMAVMQNDFLPPATAGDARFIVYATDGRGGFDTREFRIQVR